jgi:lysozyme
VWTTGFGATVYLDGRRVQPNDPPISREAARRLLRLQITQVYQPATRSLCPLLAGKSLGAITDFALNLGPTRLKGSTLRRRLLARDWDAAAIELRKWVRGGGRVLPGLVLRREAEARLLLAGR